MYHATASEEELCIYSLHSISLSFLFLVFLQFYQDLKDLSTDQPGDPCSETVHEVLGQYHIQSNSRVELLAIVNLDYEQRRRSSSYNSYQRRLHADLS